MDWMTSGFLCVNDAGVADDPALYGEARFGSVVSVFGQWHVAIIAKIEHLLNRKANA